MNIATTMRRAWLLVPASLLGLALWMSPWLVGETTDAAPEERGASRATDRGPAFPTPQVPLVPVPAAVYSSDPKPLGSVPMASGRMPGAEGWGPHIRHALEQGTPQLAYDASTQIFVCENTAELVERIEKRRAVTVSAKESNSLTDLLASYLDDQRACQTVTPDIVALKPLLVRKAALGGVFGAAASCLSETTCADMPADDKARLFAALKADATKGDEHSLYTVSMRLGDPSMPDDERQVFVLAYKMLQARDSQLIQLAPFLKEMGPWAKDMQEAWGARSSFSTPPTEEMRRQADAIVKAYEQRHPNRKS